MYAAAAINGSPAAFDDLKSPVGGHPESGTSFLHWHFVDFWPAAVSHRPILRLNFALISLGDTLQHFEAHFLSSFEAKSLLERLPLMMKPSMRTLKLSGFPGLVVHVDRHIYAKLKNHEPVKGLHTLVFENIGVVFNHEEPKVQQQPASTLCRSSNMDLMRLWLPLLSAKRIRGIRFSGTAAEVIAPDVVQFITDAKDSLTDLSIVVHETKNDLDAETIPFRQSKKQFKELVSSCGNIRTLKVKGVDDMLSSIVQARAMCKLQSLTLEHCGKLDYHDLVTLLGRSPELHELQLTPDGLQDRDPGDHGDGQIPKWALKSLRFHSDEVTDKILIDLVSSATETFSIANSKFVSDRFHHEWLQKSAPTKLLDFSAVSVSGVAEGHTLLAKGCPTLTTVDLSGNTCSTVCSVVQQLGATCHVLKSLRLTGCRRTGLGYGGTGSLLPKPRRVLCPQQHRFLCGRHGVRQVRCCMQEITRCRHLRKRHRRSRDCCSR